MSTGKVIPLQKVDTKLNADAVEWCPYPGLEHILLCGTYKLQDATTPVDDTNGEPKVTSNAPQVRVGGVTVYQIVFVDSSNPHLQKCDSVDMSGVLDIKWPETELDDKGIFGIVDADGYFQLFHLRDGNYSAEFASKVHLSESSLGLSLGWAEPQGGDKTLVAASDSAGCVTVIEVSDNVSIKSSWHAHDYEAWITAFQRFDSNIVYSGGDDCKLKGWDLRETSQPIFCSRRHQMGVCSIQSHPFREHIFASGSYDEELMIWDRRSIKQPLWSTSLGGGVWRIKWDPFQGTKILTATMYNGTHIVDCSDLGQNPLPIIAHYNDHNLAYGADWCSLTTDGIAREKGADAISYSSKNAGNSDIKLDFDSFLISTCSFYDQSLHLWQWSSQ